jgi:hypothetical protein
MKMNIGQVINFNVVLEGIKVVSDVLYGMNFTEIEGKVYSISTDTSGGIGQRLLGNVLDDRRYDAQNMVGVTTTGNAVLSFFGELKGRIINTFSLGEDTFH